MGLGCNYAPCTAQTDTYTISGPSGNVLYTVTETASLASPVPSGWTLINQGDIHCVDYPTCSINDATDLYATQFYKVIDLTGMATPLNLTVNWTETLPLPPWDIPGEWLDPQLWYDTHFVLTQTAYAFRPWDASDPSVLPTPCTPLQPNNPPNDNCHITLSAALTTPGPLVQAPLVINLPGLRRVSIERKQRGPHAEAGQDSLLLPVSYSFVLSLPTYRSGQYMQGTSTNWTPPSPRNAAEPDYIFEKDTNINASLAPPSGDGLTIGTASPLEGVSGANSFVTVTSHDFGGVAQLRLQATFQGQGPSGAGLTYFADIIDGTTGTPAAVPIDNTLLGHFCQTDYTLRGPYASLPLDTDCNGMADSWQAPYAGPSGFLDPMADDEPGYAATSPKGDGWSVHDEYRGFHYVADDGVTPKWTSTDPVAKFDVFFWDTSVVPQRQKSGTTYSFTKALRDILCRQGIDTEMDSGAGGPNCTSGINEANTQLGIATNPLRYLYRRVNAQQAHAVITTDATYGVYPFNANSIALPRNSVTKHYAVVYNPARLNSSGDYNLVDYTQSKKSGYSLILGKYQPSDPPPEDPTVSLKRLDIDADAMNAFKESLRSFPQPTLMAQTLAHETGHHFGLLHTMRGLAYPLTSTTVTQDTFTFPDNSKSTSRTINVIMQQPYSFSGKSVAAETVLFPGALQTTSKQVSGSKVSSSAPYPVANPPIYLYPYQVTGTIDVGKSDGPWVQAQVRRLMDWTPYLNLLNLNQWRFESSSLEVSSLNKLCAKVPCQ